MVVCCQGNAELWQFSLFTHALIVLSHQMAQCKITKYAWITPTPNNNQHTHWSIPGINPKSVSIMLRRRTEPHPVSIATAKGGKKKAMMHSTRHFALHGIIQYSLENMTTDSVVRNCVLRANFIVCWLWEAVKMVTVMVTPSIKRKREWEAHDGSSAEIHPVIRINHFKDLLTLYTLLCAAKALALSLSSFLCLVHGVLSQTTNIPCTTAPMNPKKNKIKLMIQGGRQKPTWIPTATGGRKKQRMMSRGRGHEQQ